MADTMEQTMDETRNSDEELVFEAPGGGSWMLDTTHHGRRPISRYMQADYLAAFPPAFATMIERFGLPLSEFRAAFVNGYLYFRPVGIGEPDNPKGGPPPLALLKLVARVHPQLRRRNRIAKQAWAERRWRNDVDQWFEGGRAEVVAKNLQLQDVEIEALTDSELADHLTDLRDHFSEQAYLSGSTHGGDIIPVGDFMAHCQGWGIDLGEAASLLVGASPASTETAELLAPVGRAIAESTTSPSSVDEIRALNSEADAAVDSWLRHHGHRLLTSDDIDGETLFERPDLQRNALIAAKPQPTPPAVPDPGRLREVVPADERELFDQLLAEARYGLRLRDDNVGVRWNWSAGLVRRGVIEAGRRLERAGKLAVTQHAIEFAPDELDAILRGNEGPFADEIERRWTHRERVIASEPPVHLGPEGSEPPLEAFPAPLARATGAMLAMIEAMNGTVHETLQGVGVGRSAHTGRAVVVSDAIEALERAEPGDVVVAPFTGPSWNSLLPSIGALVVEEGGPMSHAAIVAREFEVPTIVGVANATTLIPDGVVVTVDPAAGRIIVE